MPHAFLRRLLQALVVGCLVALPTWHMWHILASAAFDSAAPAAAARPAAETREPSDVSFALDGVTVTVRSPFLPTFAFVTSLPSDVSQVATAAAWRPFQEFSVSAVPFGTEAGTEALPMAEAGAAGVYYALLRDYRIAQGGAPQNGPAATIFGKQAVSLASLVNLDLNGQDLKPTLVVEWVVEAGQRLWIVRITQEQAAGDAGLPGVFAFLSSLEGVVLSSDTLDNASTVAASRNDAGVRPAGNDLGVQGALADLPTPPWWNGKDCDYDRYYAGSGGWRSYRLGAVFQGMPACGPRHSAGAPDVAVYFFSGAHGALEWECVELSMRYMYLSDGVRPYPANGKDVVRNYSGSVYEKVSNGTANKAPVPGDVLSSGASSTYGHTMVVSDSNVNSSGNGSITIIEQNSSSGGSATMTVSNWIVIGSPSVIGWLRHPGAGLTPTSTPVASPTNTPAATRTWTPTPRPAALTITGVRFSPITLTAGDLLQVEIGVRNDTGVTALTQGPAPGFTYNEGDTPDSRGYPDIRNRWRVGVEFAGRSSSVKDHPYRWGLGADLASGSSVTVTGYILLTTPRATIYWVGLVQEAVRWWQDTWGTTSIAVGPGVGENNLLFAGGRMTLAAHVYQCTPDAARVKVWKAYSTSSAAYLYTMARPAGYACGALNTTYNQYQLTIIGGAVPAWSWATQCTISGGVRNVWRANTYGRNVPYQYPEVAAVCPL